MNQEKVFMMEKDPSRLVKAWILEGRKIHIFSRELFHGFWLKFEISLCFIFRQNVPRKGVYERSISKNPFLE